VNSKIGQYGISKNMGVAFQESRIELRES